MRSNLKRVLSAVAIVSALGAAAAINVNGAKAFGSTCTFVPFVTNSCAVVSPSLPGVTAGSAWFIDGTGADFLGAFDQLNDPGFNRRCRARANYLVGAAAVTNLTTAAQINTQSAYVPGANPPGSVNEGYFPEAGRAFPLSTQIDCN